MSFFPISYFEWFSSLGDPESSSSSEGQQRRGDRGGRCSSRRDMDCPICLDVFNVPVTTPCGHTFCMECISKLTRCPLDRESLPPVTKFRRNVVLEDLIGRLKLYETAGLTVTEIDFKELHDRTEIGQGGFGKVYRCKWNDLEVACKVLLQQTLTPEGEEEFKKEVAMMNSIRHPNIVLFMGACTTTPLCMVTEFLPRSSLWHHLRSTNNQPLPRTRAIEIALDTARGLRYLHSRGVLHRDLKSSNILLAENFQAKICDFGLSRIKGEINANALTLGVGTAQWMAPEVVQSRQYDSRADIYSFGIILWEMMTGEVPFQNMRPAQVGFAVVAGVRPKLPATLLADSLGGLVERCWSQDLEQRPDASAIIRELQEMLSGVPTPRTRVRAPSYYGLDREEIQTQVRRERKAVDFWQKSGINAKDSALDLRGIKFDNEESLNLAAALRVHNELSSLTLGSVFDHEALSSISARALAASALENKALVHFDIRGHILGEHGIGAIAEGLAVNDTLKRLHLFNNRIESDGIVLLAEALKLNVGLKELHICNSFVTEMGGGVLADALKFNRTLEELRLRTNVCGDAGAGAFADALRVNQTLKHLHLGDNAITSAGAIALAESLKQANRGLRELHLEENALALEGESALADALHVNRFVKVFATWQYKRTNDRML
mmetsp:Transcript_20149/g.33065  ORF Transcript_20149/g.33065 Transcript_20149/m.33065 type:complete len:666 (+) Transcript_20149:94-2091(+)